MNKLTKINKVDISLKQLSDVNTQNDSYDRVDNIRNGQILTAYVNAERPDQFRFKYLTDILVAGSGITFSTTNGITTISSTGGGAAYTVDNGLTPNPTANNFQLGGSLLADTNLNGSGNYSLNFLDLYKHQVNSFDYTELTSFDATLAYGYSAKLLLDGKGSLYKPGLSLTVQDTVSGDEVGIQIYDVGAGVQQLWAKPHNYSAATTGDVLTLQADGTTEFQTPASGGLLHGTASGTNNYTVTISGVTSYADGDAYLIKFTNGNDADSDININGLGVKTLVKQFDIQLTGGDIVSGQELIIMYDGTNFQTLGVAPNQLFAYVTNDDSVTITKGQPVYAFGAAGNRMSVKLAYNTGDATSAQTVGLVFSSSIAANQRGFIITQGVISGVNTAAYSAGNQLYLGATAGTLTATKPYAPNHLVYIGIVERANAGNGQIYVKPQNGYELDELHNVQAQSPTLKDTLWYDNAVSPAQWKTASIPTILGYTPANIDSPAFTGNPTAPTPSSGDNDTSIATTAFVTSAVQQSLSFVGYFGAGTDGNVTVSASITLTSDMYYNDLTIAAGGSIYLAGYRIFVKGNLDLTNAGALGIHNNGYAGSNNLISVSGAVNGTLTAGRGGYGSTVYGWFIGGSAASKNKGGFGGAGGSASANGTNAPAVTVLLATEGLLGGNGGASGAGGNSASGATGGTGIVGQGTGITVAGYTTYTPQTFMTNPSTGGTFFSKVRQDTANTTNISYTGTTYIYYGGGHGSGGGGGGANAAVAGMGGGAGGGGGGTVVIFARNIIIGASTNAQAIAANGGDGGTGASQPTFNGTGGGGAGAGGGGFVYLVAGSISGTSGITFISANGGTGGAGGSGRGAGNFGGQGGSGGYGGKIVVTKLATNTVTVTDTTTTAASAASAPTGIAGTAGTAGVTCTYSS